MDWKKECIRWRGKVLHGKFSHWCDDWDGLPVDETTREFDCCTCSFGAPHPKMRLLHLYWRLEDWWYTLRNDFLYLIGRN